MVTEPRDILLLSSMANEFNGEEDDLRSNEDCIEQAVEESDIVHVSEEAMNLSCPGIVNKLQKLKTLQMISGSRV